MIQQILLDMFAPVIDIIVSLSGIVLIGAIFALLSNNIIDRITTQQSIIFPEPYCWSCAVSLKWTDLIPVVSYFKTKGLCPYCGVEISKRKIFLDFIIIAWVGIFIIKFGWAYETLFGLLMGICLISIMVIEFERRILSGSLLLFMVLFSSIYILAFNPLEFPSATLGLFIGSAVLLIFNILKLATLNTKSINGNEIKLGAVLGFYFITPKIILCVLISWLIGAIWGMYQTRINHKSVKVALPDYTLIFSISALFTILFGEDLITCYLAWMM